MHLSFKRFLRVWGFGHQTNKNEAKDIDADTLFDMIWGSHSIDEIRELYMKYNKSFLKAWGSGLVVTSKIFALRLEDLEKRVSKLETTELKEKKQ